MLSQLTPAHLSEYYSKALKSGRRDGKGGLAVLSVKHHHRLLSEALSYAVQMEMLVRNPALVVKQPKTDTKEMKVLDWDGVKQLLETAKGSPYYHLFHLALYTGLRRSELVGLKWQSVDLERGSLSVIRTLQRVPGVGLVELEPKTKRSKRAISLSKSALEALRLQGTLQAKQKLAAGPAWQDAGYVFARPDGQPLSPDAVTHAFKRIMESLGIPNVRLHDLRHTHATRMMKQGWNPKIVSERLGHVGVGITLDTYSHVIPGLQEDAAAMLDETLIGP